MSDEITEQLLREMPLHSEVSFAMYTVLRVIGGWIYRHANDRDCKEKATFVPEPLRPIKGLNL